MWPLSNTCFHWLLLTVNSTLSVILWLNHYTETPYRILEILQYDGIKTPTSKTVLWAIHSNLKCTKIQEMLNTYAMFWRCWYEAMFSYGIYAPNSWTIVWDIFLTFSRLIRKCFCNAFEYECEQYMKNFWGQLGIWRWKIQVYWWCCGESAKRIFATLKSTIDVFKYNTVIP